MSNLVKIRIPRFRTSDKEYVTDDETAEVTSSPLFRRFVRPCVGELFGTMIYTFCSCLSFTASLTNQFLMVSISQGLITMALVGTIGHVSGAHMNPAVSFGLWIGGGLSFVLFALYITVQILGAFIGALLFRAVLSRTLYANVAGAVVYINETNTTKGQAILVELCCCFLWTLSILQTVVDSDGTSPYAPLSIGSTVFVASAISYSLTRASMNPARAIGAQICSSVFNDETDWTDHYIYWIGAVIGAALAATLYRLILSEDRNRVLFKRN